MLRIPFCSATARLLCVLFPSKCGFLFFDLCMNWCECLHKRGWLRSVSGHARTSKFTQSESVINKTSTMHN
jgi:hypothetical protein